MLCSIPLEQVRSAYTPARGIRHQTLGTLHDLYPVVSRIWTRFWSSVISAQGRCVALVVFTVRTLPQLFV